MLVFRLTRVITEPMKTTGNVSTYLSSLNLDNCKSLRVLPLTDSLRARFAR